MYVQGESAIDKVKIKLIISLVSRKTKKNKIPTL